MKAGRFRSASRRLDLSAAAAFVIGLIGCIVGAIIDPAGFCRAWLCTYLFWLGVPLCGVTLTLVHDLTGGQWMATARPVLNAATLTMPLATLAGIPAFIGLSSIFSWTHPAPDLNNTFYLNPTAFYLRYAIDIVLWNGLAAFSLWGPRGEAAPIVPALSWISGIGLIVLALSASFASIDWILSLEPAFWSSIFPMATGAGWFNTGMALVVLTVAVLNPTGERRGHMADLAAILLATTIFWAYAEFIQFLIIWEENLKSEITWYLVRIDGPWLPAMFVGAALGFFVPFFALLTAPAKRNRLLLIVVCGLILVSRVADKWWLVLPEFSPGGAFWLDIAAILALGGPMLFLFSLGLGSPWLRAPSARLAAGHG
jgi:hypothetical protein